MRWKWEEKAVCPHTYKCPDGLASFGIGNLPSYLNIISSGMSCLGSILILITYLVLRDMRTGAQKIITLLAIADFFCSLGFLLGSVNFLAYGSLHTDCALFTTMCEIQSFITIWPAMSSFCWTTILAFYFFLVLVYNKGKLAMKLMPLYNVIAWLGPLLIEFPMLVAGRLGYAHYGASNWCFIKDDSDMPLTKNPQLILIILFACKLWEVVSYIIVVLFYMRVRWSIVKVSYNHHINNYIHLIHL